MSKFSCSCGHSISDTLFPCPAERHVITADDAASDWQRLKQIAAEISTEERKVSLGQVAAILLRNALASHGPSETQIAQWLYDHHPGRAFDEELG